MLDSWRYSLIGESLFRRFSAILTDNFLILGSINALDPADLTKIVVCNGVVEYPIPGFITLTSTILPSLITGLNSAPEPNLSLPLTSLTIKSGIEVYSLPPNSKFTFVSSVPINEMNMDYAQIKRQVDAGELTIEDAD